LGGRCRETRLSAIPSLPMERTSVREDALLDIAEGAAGA
jgi:hypothetical protein